MRHFLMFCVSVYLVACSFSGSLPERLVLYDVMPSTRWFQASQIDAMGNVMQSTLLAVEPFTGEACPDAQSQQYCLRFVQTDALGSPVSRQIVSPQGQWRHDGFLPPNSEARHLFSAVAQQFGFMNYADAHVNVDSKGQSTLLYQKKWLWRSHTEQNRIIYVFPNQNRWLVSPVEE